MAGVVAAIVELSIAFSWYFSHSGDLWNPIAQAVLSRSGRWSGPGAWSIDARLFGRKRIDMPGSVATL